MVGTPNERLPAPVRHVPILDERPLGIFSKTEPLLLLPHRS